VISEDGALTTTLVGLLAERESEVTPVEATLFALGIHEDTGSLTHPTATQRDAEALAWCLRHGARQPLVEMFLHTPLGADERDLLTVPTDILIRGADLPKLPQYLPRPLPPDVDAQPQRRLARSENTYKLGLLLMRRTGLRVSELINLPSSCLRIDPKGNKFLKVPLGKLDTERLVPLDRHGLKALNKLRRLGARRRAFLLESSPARKTTYRFYRDAIHSAADGLDAHEPITTHRLRHTYATALLAGGMSLVGLMRLLGHKDYRMTLRYAAITDETVLIEYVAALDRSTQRYAVPAPSRPVVHLDPAQQLNELARNLHLRIGDDHLDPARARLLVRRLRRLATELRRLAKTQKTTV
jgi:integrase